MLRNWKLATGMMCTGVLLAGCSTPTPMPGPQPVTETHVENCYRMDAAEQERAGQAKIEEGVQFYYTSNCAQHLASDLALKDDQGKDKTEADQGDESVPDWIDDRENPQGDGAGAAVDAEFKKGENAESDKSESQSSDQDGGQLSGKGVNESSETDGGQGEAVGEWDFSNKAPTCYYDKMTAASDLPPCGKDFYNANPHLR